MYGATSFAEPYTIFSGVLTISRISIIQKTYTHANRYREILMVLFKYGFEEIIDRLHIDTYVDLGLKLMKRPDRTEAASHSMGERVRLTLEELGPTFIKFGQILSTQADVLPPDVVKELEKLQSEVPAFPFENVREIIEEEFGNPLEELFTNFHEEPLAAASIGQVHVATLQASISTNREEVVVKVQRPGIEKMIETDLEIMYHLSLLLEKHVEGFDVIQPTLLVRRFGRIIRKEIDFLNEAANIERFAEQFEDDEFINTPKVWHERTSRRVLTMEKVGGLLPTDTEAIRLIGQDPAVIAQQCYVRIIEQILHHGFFHADPHPGNLFVRKNGTVVYIDYGMMGTLSQMEREFFTDLIMAISMKNTREASRALISLTEWEDEPNRAKLQRSIDDFIDQHLNKSLKQVHLSDVLQDLMDLLVDHQMRLPQSMLMVIKALSTVEGIGRRLDPEFDPIEQAKPTVLRLQQQRYKPEKLLSEGIRTAVELSRVLSTIPTQVQSMLNQLQQGKTRMNIHLTDIQPLLQSLVRTGNLIAIAILTGCLVIGSSLIVHSGVPPKIGEIPVIGVIGYLLSALTTVYLLIILIRGNVK